jgi:hypothetical protein
MADIHIVCNDPDFPHAVILPDKGLMGQPAAGIDYHACRAFSRDKANSELGVIGQRCANPNHNGINQCAQLVEVG